MEILTIENLKFTYPGGTAPALTDVSFSVEAGSFITLCGKSGCGKTTLLRLLKPALSPHGATGGEVRYKGEPLSALSHRAQTEEIGFVLQSPDNQLVTDKVWHELAFGPESLGMPTGEIRARVAEMASFFGIQTWFHEKVETLSGGQKQLLNLAAVMVMRPSLLLLDEPTSQLDPIAAGEFIQMLGKINRELGTTVILCEHRPDEAFAVSDRILVMDEGRILADAPPAMIGEKVSGHDMALAMPVPMRIFQAVEGGSPSPVSVREGRRWLEGLAKRPDSGKIPEPGTPKETETVIELKDVFFRYEKNGADVVRGLSAAICRGELFAIVGGNGAGKTTALSLMAGLLTPYRGKVRIKGEPIHAGLWGSVVSVLPQNPQTLFTKKTVREDLQELCTDTGRVEEVAALCHIAHLLDRHPFDLSGGEQLRAALAKVLLPRPEILMMDEPTKGMDAHFKRQFAGILQNLCRQGVTVVMVSHDIEFCAEYADRCAMFFDGGVASVDEPRAFFAGKSFYTTAANRMARSLLPEAVLCADVIAACGGRVETVPPKPVVPPVQKAVSPEKPVQKKSRFSPVRIVAGAFFALCFALALYFGWDFLNGYDWKSYTLQAGTLLLATAALICLLPKRNREKLPERTVPLSKRTVLSALFVLLAVPCTVLLGVYVLEDRKYYFISLLVILEIMIPFALAFEGRKPSARELILVSVLCALGVAGRTAFYMLPQFKPVAALVILAGVALGGETGFLVGAVTAFVSNFFFGQGPWTPWQMFVFGLIGFLAGVLVRGGILRKSRISLCIFGAVATFFIYGGIMNPSSLLLWQPHPTMAEVLSSFALGAPFDAVHALSTAVFLWFAAEPMLEKLERIKEKYDILR